MKIVMIVLCLVFVSHLSATIINVPADQPTIQAGINASVNTDTVLVQPGTYVENINYNGKNITVASLFLTTQDTIYIFQTIIDGNQDGSVVTFETGEDSTVILVGFTIINGYNQLGGGIYCTYNSSPSLLNVIISNNSAEIRGGGIYCEGNSNINLSNSTLIDNSAYYGGGFYIFESNPEIEYSIFDGNSAYDGGGIYCYTNSNPIIKNNRIKNNTATVSGGGIYFYNGSVSSTINNEFNYNEALVGGGISILDANPSIINNNFNHNEAGEGGGIHISVSSCIMINNTISNNTATYQGGGISITYMSSPITINTILWGNEANLSGNEIYIRHYDCEPEFYYCDIQGGLNAFGYGQGANFNGEFENNIDSDPLFLGSGEYPFSLLNNSPCIDAGIPDTTGLNLPEYDLASNPRVNNNHVDMGAYEWQGTQVEDEELVVRNCELSNYPNPFNPSTTISFSIPEESNVELLIFNIKGQKVKTVANKEFLKGSHSFIWNGDDKSGKAISSGVYLYKLNVNGKTEAMKKCLLLK